MNLGFFKDLQCTSHVIPSSKIDVVKDLKEFVTAKFRDSEDSKKLPSLHPGALLLIHGCRSASCGLILLAGSLSSILSIRSLPSTLTDLHSDGG
mmetsp:Transcript_21771/g.49291  ORF Transcript_21771/g.49291 Transcript_21771/m.49291 type:complete len:94 (-) Transcript_21771:799-1080(-)